MAFVLSSKLCFGKREMKHMIDWKNIMNTGFE